MEVIRKIAKDMPHYLPLLGIFALGLLAFVIFSYDRVFQAGVAISVSIAYLSWGIIHHYLHNDLELEVFLEYLGISMLGLALILFAIFRA